MPEVLLRSLPARTVVRLSRHGTAPRIDSFFDEAFARLRLVKGSWDGFGADSDGSAESCLPVAAHPNPKAAADLRDGERRP